MAFVPLEYRCLHCEAFSYGKGETIGTSGVDEVGFGEGETAGWVSIHELDAPPSTRHPGPYIYWAGCPSCASTPISSRPPPRSERAPAPSIPANQLPIVLGVSATSVEAELLALVARR